MRIILDHLDKLRRTAIVELAGFCGALVSQFEDIARAANAWAAEDHNSDGTHQVVKVGGNTSVPVPTLDRITIYKDGNDLKVVKPDGTIGTITVV